MTIIRNKNKFDKSEYREVFDVETKESRLKIYIKSALKVYEVFPVGEAVIDKEEFCASRLTFYLLKDDVISFNQGDAVSVKYDGEVLFYGYVFSKSRDKKNLIKTECYDQLRYMKNRRSYTRGSMNLGEIVRKLCDECALYTGEIESSAAILPPVAADNVSLLDVVKKACAETRRISGKRYIFYDDGGKLNLKDEKKLVLDVLIDPSQAENFVYSDTIDRDVYNKVQLYSDTKRLNLREITTLSDKETMARWGTLILTKKATDPLTAYNEGKLLLDEYNRINREIVLKRVNGDVRFIPGCSVLLQMVMGDIAFDGYVRIKRAVHTFKNNFYWADLYVDGSEVE